MLANEPRTLRIATPPRQTRMPIQAPSSSGSWAMKVANSATNTVSVLE